MRLGWSVSPGPCGRRFLVVSFGDPQRSRDALDRLLARSVAVIALAGAASAVASSPAAAHGGTKTIIGLNFGFGFPAWPYYYPPYYYPPPVVYAPPPVVYAPSAVVYAQPAPVMVTPAPRPYVARNGQTCREYQSTAVIGGMMRPVYGTACLQPDGAWRIVN